MVTGAPGSGKTTLLCEMLADIDNQPGQDGLFISMEMNEIDMASYTKRFPEWGSLNIYFPDFTSSIYEDVKTLLEHGFDMVAIDSFKELKDIVADEQGWTKTKTERELINLMQEAMLGNNDTGTHTCFYVIQQVLKSGDFAGSKRLEHLMTANLKMVVEGGESYLYFEKNRRGNAHRKLFYRIKENEIVFDGERREMEEEAIEFTEKEKERQQESQEEFDSIDDLLNNSSGNGALPDTEDEVDDDLVEIEEDVDGPVEDKTNVDPDIFARVYRYHDGNLNATRRTMHEIGAAPELTYYYAGKIAEEAGVK
jgi:predicted ATP-dependent serine protease